jgi:hypothetical protein
MAKKTALTVVTPFGTFTRTTARTYTHLVVVKGYRAELLDAKRVKAIESSKRTIAEYLQTIETGRRPDERGAWDREVTTTFLAEGRYQEWLAEERTTLARLQALAPITKDGTSWNFQNTEDASWGIVGWCGRLDLAVKLFNQQDEYRHAAIVALDGTVVTQR